MRTLLDVVEKYAKIDKRFHTPGHEIGGSESLYSNAIYDVTELDITDNLIKPSGVILDLEKELAKIYGAKRTLVITSGATTGNFIMLNVIKKLGKTLVVGGAHKSIYNGLELFNVPAVFMEERLENGIVKFPTKEELNKYLDDVASVVITSPNYFGKVIDTDIIKWLQSKGKVVVVDEAHGGHFVFSSLLPRSLSSVADIVVDSLHKTLPVYTGGALIHINNEALIAETEFYHSILHTSSPSYVTMCSIDFMQDKFQKEGESLYAKLKDVVDSIKLDRFKVIKTDDFSRLVIDVFPFSADSVREELERRGVYIEMSYSRYLVLILSPLNIDKLIGAIAILKDIENDGEALIRFEKANLDAQDFGYQERRECKKNAYFVDVSEAVGKVARCEIGVYPPGIPFIKSGERIDEQKIDYILSNPEKIFGLTSGKIRVEEE